MGITDSRLHIELPGKWGRENPDKDEVQQPKTEIEEESLHALEMTQQTIDALNVRFETLAEEAEDGEKKETVDAEIDSIKRAYGNFRKAYQQLWAIGDEFSARWSELQKKKIGPFVPAPPNGVIDVQEEKSDHFARGMNLYKILLICYAGSFAGVVVEMLWCLVYKGYIESRAGLVYGPFNPLYGIGAVVMTAALYRFRNHSASLSFFGGMLVGAVVEYVCSWAQETVFGSRSWDYSDRAFNLNGRICLLFCIFWGILGVWWIKSVLPRLTKWILKIPNRAGKIGTWIFTVFFVFNCAVSLVAVARWSQRLDGVEASNSFWEFIDERFPDERMERVYANMEF